MRVGRYTISIDACTPFSFAKLTLYLRFDSSENIYHKILIEYWINKGYTVTHRFRDYSQIEFCTLVIDFWYTWPEVVVYFDLFSI